MAMALVNILASLLFLSLSGCATPNTGNQSVDIYSDDFFERQPNSLWEALKAFWSAYDDTPPPITGWDLEQLALVKGGELAVTIKNISFASEKPKQWLYLLRKMEQLEKVAVCLENHPYPSDPAQQEKLDRTTKYISQLRIAGDLAEEALRHADAELLSEAQMRVEKAMSLYP
jgi:hypothetical protein